MPAGINQVMAITGREKDGYTRIRLTSNNIERMITVNTNHNYTFHMKGIVNADGTLTQTQVVRGKPNDVVTIEYEVYPPYNKVWWFNDEDDSDENYGNGYDQNKKTNYEDRRLSNAQVAKMDSIDTNTQRITIKLVQSGYTVLKFGSDYNKANDLYLEIPVYVYYDRVNLTWSTEGRSFLTDSGTNNANKSDYFSHGDFANTKPNTPSGYGIINNAVYVADNESIEISYLKDARGPMGFNDSTSPYPGARVMLKTATLAPSDSNVKLNIDNIGANKIIVEYRLNGNSDRKPGTTTASLFEVEYVGILTVSYSYYTGKETISDFSRQIMVYREVWARKP
jgi:hypothetical protein